MRARPLLQKAFWAVLAFGCVYLAFHEPAHPPRPAGQVVPTDGWIYPWPSTWEC